MKILGNISSGYKRIATGIAIVSFLAIMYLALIPGASIAHVYGPDGGVLSGVFIFIKEWPQYNTTTDIDGSYAINNVPYGEYTLVAMGNDSYAPNISEMYVDQASNPKDINLKAAKKYYLPFLYQNEANVYQAGAQVQNNGTSNASTEITFYYGNGTKAGNDFNIIGSGILSDRMVYDITGTINQFTGPSVVKSDVPVQVGGYIRTMASDVYSLASSFTDADASTSAYIPFVYNGGLYESGVQIFNPGNEMLERTITFYYSNGTIAYTNTNTIPPKVFQGNRLSILLPGVSFTGPVNITSNRSFVAQGYIRTLASGVYSIAPSISTPVTNLTIPFVYNGGFYESGVQVFNPGNNPATYTIKFYYTNGTLAKSNTSTVPSKNMQGNRLSILLPGITFTGSATITSDQPVVAQGYIRTIASSVYSVAPQVRKPASIQDIHIPYLKSSSTHNGGVQVVNANDVNATVTVRFYYANGTLATESTQEIVPNYLKGNPLASMLPGVDFTGYSIISADQPVVAQGFIRTIASNIYGVAPPVER